MQKLDTVVHAYSSRAGEIERWTLGPLVNLPSLNQQASGPGWGGGDEEKKRREEERVKGREEKKRGICL